MPCAYLALVQQAIRLTRPHFMQAARWGVAIGSIGFFLLYEDLPQLILQTQYGNWRGWCARQHATADTLVPTPTPNPQTDPANLPPPCPRARPPAAASVQDGRRRGVWPD